MGQPAARVGDMHVCPMVTPGVPPIPHVGGPVLPPGGVTVLIGGVPAARMGDMCTCVGPPDIIAKGSTGVFIMGMPAARMGDLTAHGGTIVIGMPTVLIGEVMPSPPPIVPPPLVSVIIGIKSSQVSSARNLRDLAKSMQQPQKGLANQSAAFLDSSANGTPFCEKCAMNELKKQFKKMSKEERRAALRKAIAELKRKAAEARMMEKLKARREAMQRATEAGNGFCEKCGGK